MGARRAMPHWYDIKLMLGLWIGLPMLGVSVSLTLPLLNRICPREANAAMLASPAPIDGKRAYKYLKEICAIGPRPAGTEANSRQRTMVSKHFSKMGAIVRDQPFTGTDPRSG